MKKIIIAFILVFAYYSGSSQQDKKSLVTENQVDHLFADWDNIEKPGIAIGIVKDGKIDHLRGYGSANLEHKVAIDPIKTKFLFQGMSDQMVCFLILQMADGNQLSLNDPISKYLESIPFGNEIQIQHLMNHTSGLNDVAMMKPIVGFSEFESFTYDNMVSALSIQKKLSSQPGERFANNRTEIRLLQSIVEKISGKSIEEYANTQIFIPLEMTNSLFTSNASEIIPNKAQGYSPVGDKYQINKTVLDDTQTSFFYSTVEDMCKWAANFSRIKIGNQNIINKMEMICVENGKSMELKNSTLHLGQHNYWDFKGTRKFYLIGQKNGYACKLVRFPDQDLSIVVMGNAGAYNGYMSSDAADLYLEKYYQIEESQSEESEAGPKLSYAQLEKYCGKYWDEEVCFTTIISLENDTLRYREIENGWMLNLVPTSKNSFVGNYGQQVSFLERDNKMVLRLEVGGSNIYHSAKFDDVSWTSNLNKFEGTYRNKEFKTAYSISQVGDNLVLEHAKLGKYEMFPLSKNTFRINDRKLRCVKFDTGGNSFSLSNSRIKDVMFEREENDAKM